MKRIIDETWCPWIRTLITGTCTRQYPIVLLFLYSIAWLFENVLIPYEEIVFITSSWELKFLYVRNCNFNEQTQNLTNFVRDEQNAHLLSIWKIILFRRQTKWLLWLTHYFIKYPWTNLSSWFKHLFSKTRITLSFCNWSMKKHF